MKRFFTLGLFFVLFQLMVAAPAVAQDASLFESFKQLAGTWDADLDEDGKFDSVVDYRLIAAGSVVTETLFAGTSHEMITVYCMDGARLLCTHYCASGNQPRMQGTRLADGTIAFKMIDATNLPDRNASHMNSVTYTFVDANHMSVDWGASENGKDTPHAVFRLTRRVPPAEPTKQQPTEKPVTQTPPQSDFMILMYEDDNAWARMPKERQDELMALYMAWMGDLQTRGIFKYGAPCGAKHVLLRGSGATGSVEEITPTKDVLTGIFVVRVSSLDEAVALAKSCPALLHGERVVVRPVSHE